MKAANKGIRVIPRPVFDLDILANDTNSIVLQLLKVRAIAKAGHLQLDKGLNAEDLGLMHAAIHDIAEKINDDLSALWSKLNSGAFRQREAANG